MGLFSPKKVVDPAPTEPEDASTGPRAKTIPTPKRREAEAARRRRLNPQLDPKTARRLARKQANDERMKAMAERDGTPGKRLIRNWVDARWNITEWSMPIMFAILALLMLVAPANPGLIEPFTYGTWFVTLAIAFDMVMMWRGYKKLAARLIPNEPTKGLLMYAVNRSLSLRSIRSPRPQVKRGQKLAW